MACLHAGKAELVVEKVQGGQDDFMNSNLLVSCFRHSAKNSEVINDVRCALNLALGRFKTGDGVLLRLWTPSAQVLQRVSDQQSDVVERIIEFMRHASGQLSDGREFGRLHQLRLLFA